MTHVITSLCTRQGDCVDVCPTECIVPGAKGDSEWGGRFYIDPEECIDCGACAPDCPVDAIFADDEVLAEYEEWIAKNRISTAVGEGAAASYSAERYPEGLA